MLQTPINVYPNNGEVMRANLEDWFSRFTFQGDLLTFVQGEVRNPDAIVGVDTDDYVLYNMPKDGHLSAVHNGQTVGFTDHETRVIWTRLIPGSNYQHKLRLFQHYPEGLPKAKTPLADIYYARGKIFDPADVEVTLQSNQTCIAPYLDNMHDPWYYTWTKNGTTHTILVGAIFMQIGHTTKMVSHYDRSTGVVSFQKVTYHEFIDDDYTVLEVDTITDDTVPSTFTTIGQPYKLFTNYIETGWYDFKWRTEPVLTTTIVTQVNNNSTYYDYTTDKSQPNGFKVFNGIDFESMYQQAEAVGLKWYKYQIYQLTYDDIEIFVANKTYHRGDHVLFKTIDTLGNNNYKVCTCLVDTYSSVVPTNDDWKFIDLEEAAILIEDMDRQYTYELRTTYPINPFLTRYVVRLTVATQDNDVAWLETGVVELPTNTTDADDHEPYYNHLTINDTSATIDSTSNVTKLGDSSIVKINWDWNGFVTSVFRREVFEDGSIADEAVYIGVKDESNYDAPVYDYSIGNKKNYRYELVSKSSIATEYGKPIAIHYIHNVSADWDGWRILGAVPTEDYSNNNRQGMYATEEWKFISDIDSGDITHNINPVQHVGTGKYAKTVRMNNKFESGSFTANLLTVECPDNEIKDDIERVKAWIKFISGEHPFLLKSEKGDVWTVDITQNPTRQYEETYNPIWTKVHYEWAECADTDKCVFMKKKVY